MEDSVFQDASAPLRQPQRKLPKRLIILIVFILIIVFLLGTKFLGSKSENSSLSPTPTPLELLPPTDTPTPTGSSKETPTPEEASETSTPTPKPTSNPVDKTSGLDRSELSVTVQNGSGEAGVGAEGSDFLTGLGYNVSSVDNADNFDYTNVTIKVKPDKSDYLSLLEKDLGLNYTVGDTSSDLSDSFSSDALVIIGK